ncbi:MAG: DUF3098 domain-containing protein [Ignavibacteriaceae bacterium]|nr:DUF3098 domain-containing protein [Ignavibacteriaceae bacterium]
MSKVQKKSSVKSSRKVVTSPFSIYWDKNNYMFLIIGFVGLIIGFFLLASGEWDSTESQYFSPTILLIVYLIVFPLAIFYGPKLFKKKEDAGDTGQS